MIRFRRLPADAPTDPAYQGVRRSLPGYPNQCDYMPAEHRFFGPHDVEQHWTGYRWEECPMTHTSFGEMDREAHRDRQRRALLEADKVNKTGWWDPNYDPLTLEAELKFALTQAIDGRKYHQYDWTVLHDALFLLASLDVEWAAHYLYERQIGADPALFTDTRFTYEAVLRLVGACAWKQR